MNATRDNYTEVRELTSNYVRDKLDNFIENRLSPIDLSEEDFEHVVGMGVSILETKWPQIGMYEGGDFVKAVIRNDLMEAVGRGDEVNLRLLSFYCILLYNFSPDQVKYSKL